MDTNHLNFPPCFKISQEISDIVSRDTRKIVITESDAVDLPIIYDLSITLNNITKEALRNY